MWRVSPAEEGAALHSPHSDFDRNFLPEEEEYVEHGNRESMVYTPLSVVEIPLDSPTSREAEGR